MTERDERAEPDERDEVEGLLRVIGERLVLPAAPPVDPASWPGGERLRTGRARRGTGRPGRWAPAAALVLLLALIGALAVAPVREAVAGWFGIGTTSIEVDPSVDGRVDTLPGIEAAAPPIAAAEGRSAVADVLPGLDRSALGAPSGFASMPEGGTLVRWPDGTTLWVRPADPQLGMLVKKVMGSGESVSMVDGMGDLAVLIRGDHLLRTPHRTVSATTTLLWLRGPVELRLESDRPAEDLPAIGRTLVTAG